MKPTIDFDYGLTDVKVEEHLIEKENTLITCLGCNKGFEEAKVEEIKGDTYCSECKGKLFKKCVECNNTVAVEYSRISDCSGDRYCQTCFDDRFIWCENCDSEIYREDSHDGGYCESCYEDREGHEAYESKPFSLDNNTFLKIKSERCYGIELEIPDDDINTDDMCGDKTHFGCYDDLGIGMEFYSPIMQGDLGYKEIRKFCDNIGYPKMDKIAGYHMHIDTRDIAKNNDWEAIQRIWYLYANIEPLIFQLVSKSRRNNSYCEKLPIRGKDIDKILECESKTALNRLMNTYHLHRTNGLGITSWSGRKTIELRYHQATSNFYKVVNWIRLNLYLFDFAINASINGIKELLNFEDETDLEKIQYIIKTITNSDYLTKFYTERYETLKGE